GEHAADDKTADLRATRTSGVEIAPRRRIHAPERYGDIVEHKSKRTAFAFCFNLNRVLSLRRPRRGQGGIRRRRPDRVADDVGYVTDRRRRGASTRARRD